MLTVPFVPTRFFPRCGGIVPEFRSAEGVGEAQVCARDDVRRRARAPELGLQCRVKLGRRLAQVEQWSPPGAASLRASQQPRSQPTSQFGWPDGPPPRWERLKGDPASRDGGRRRETSRRNPGGAAAATTAADAVPLPQIHVRQPRHARGRTGEDAAAGRAATARAAPRPDVDAFPFFAFERSERSVDPASRRAGRPDPFEAPAGSCRTPPTLARDAGSPRAATSGGRGEQSPRLPGPARFPAVTAPRNPPDPPASNPAHL